MCVLGAFQQNNWHAHYTSILKKYEFTNFLYILPHEFQDLRVISYFPMNSINMLGQFQQIEKISMKRTEKR